MDSRVLLLIEDNPGDVNMITEMLSAPDHDGHFNIVVAYTLSDGVSKVNDCDVVLLDLSLPDSHGLATFTSFRDEIIRCSSWRPVVVVTGLDDESIGRQAIREGAQDFLVKGRFNSHTLLRSILYSLERHRRQQAEAGLATVCQYMAEIRGELSGLRKEVSEVTSSMAKSHEPISQESQ